MILVTAAAAIRGVRRVYHVGPRAHPRERDMGIALVDAARSWSLDRRQSLVDLGGDRHAGATDELVARHQLDLVLGSAS